MSKVAPAQSRTNTNTATPTTPATPRPLPSRPADWALPQEAHVASLAETRKRAHLVRQGLGVSHGDGTVVVVETGEII